MLKLSSMRINLTVRHWFTDNFSTTFCALFLSIHINLIDR